MRIAIEGMDGCGKTTVSKILVEKLGYKYVDKPFKFLFESLNINESQLKDLEWKLYETEDEALLTVSEKGSGHVLQHINSCRI